MADRIRPQCCVELHGAAGETGQLHRSHDGSSSRLLPESGGVVDRAGDRQLLHRQKDHSLHVTNNSQLQFGKGRIGFRGSTDDNQIYA